MKPTTRIGVDIGGTFTDFVLHDEERGITRTGKRPTTPDQPSLAIIEGILRLLDETNTKPEQIHSIIHGTTLITNTVLERTGAKVGLIATHGLTDVLEMRRETRFDVDDLQQRPAPEIVPRNLRRGVAGRITADGAELIAFDETGFVTELDHLVREEKIESLAISLMNSYRCPDHERRARDIAVERYPGLYVTISSEVAPVIREYERTNTACVNAYVQPRVHGYLNRLSDDLRGLGFRGRLSIMLSAGGLISAEDAKDFPVRLIESGPAAGAMGVAYLARKLDAPHVISFDMGGTTAKMCLIENGHPHVKHDFEAGRIDRFKPGSGLPLKVTVIDMIEIGSGGGSIASIDNLGLMKVGPRSAGSVPGPVAYGRGGTQPTVTDADLLLGYLNPAYFLGGEMALKLEDVQNAADALLGQPLNMPANLVAQGIQSIVNENMAGATRMHLAEKGKDPRDYAMIAFGGAGPVHAFGLARLLRLRTLIVPMGAGVISAFGFLVAPPATDDARGYLTPLLRVDWDLVNRLYDEMRDKAEQTLRGMAVGEDAIRFEWSVDMRYLGQGFEITVPIPAGPLGPEHLDAIHRAFDETYRETFGRTAKGIPVEAVNWRLTASLPAQDISLAYSVVETSAERMPRDVIFPDHGPIRTPVYDRYALKPGQIIEGPAVFEERETTFTVGPDSSVTVDDLYNLVVTLRYPDDQPSAGSSSAANEIAEELGA
ncbi:MAG: methylhydantoinase [Martelella sp.]|uniref:hydantoinase/oxoprolinase family protein n=1 Tax=unclassified Martelella TaxID=2629616 RepID=UPI000C45559B|nr:hydantoinase/oxoprolinase family protein [Martelella sp.]MAU21620.1 methylhydantoinase [Martelella sp.]